MDKLDEILEKLEKEDQRLMDFLRSTHHLNTDEFLIAYAEWKRAKNEDSK